MSQYWKQNSIAIMYNDNLIKLISGTFEHDEPIALEIMSCDSSKKEPIYKAVFDIDEAEGLQNALKDIIKHYKKIQKYQKRETK